MVFIILIGLLIWLWPTGLIATPPVPAPVLSSPVVVHLPYYRLPERLTLCGEPVPLHDSLVREELDREFIIVVWSHAQTILWLKRAARYFPYIEEKLREARLPDDLKYVAVVESDLRLEARSPSGALGPWQFMKPTANRFDLKTGEQIDERLNFISATEAALQYLKILHRRFHNWALAIAAYNCGEGRMQQAITEQGIRNYYYLSLPEETERYVLRLIAAKTVLSNPSRYGYDIPRGELYPPLQFDQVEFTLAHELPLRRVAEACGSYYKKIKHLNPWLKGATLVPGVYRLNVPAGSAPRFYGAYMRGQLTGP